MLHLRQLLAFLRLLLASRVDIVLENIVLRHQICVLSRQKKRPRLNRLDRIFWVWLPSFWAGWRLYWRWKSRRKSGRPPIRREIRELVRRMARENPLWGSPRIHGEILKLGFLVSQPTVRRSPALSPARQRLDLRRRVLALGEEHGHQGSPDRKELTLAKSIRGKADRIDPERMNRSRDSIGRTALAESSCGVSALL